VPRAVRPMAPATAVSRDTFLGAGGAGACGAPGPQPGPAGAP
jgi:hypothetical protein